MKTMFKKFFKQDPDVIDLPVNFGGYYTYKEDDGKYAAYRLLDFNKDVLHRRLLEGHFDHKPSLEEVKAMKPLMHVPQAATTLLRQTDLTLLGSEPLTKEDVSGYEQYLESALEIPHDEAEAFMEKIIGFSHEGTGKLRLRRDPNNSQSFVKA